MTIHTPSLYALHIAVAMHKLARRNTHRVLSVSAGKKHGQWVADIMMEKLG